MLPFLALVPFCSFVRLTVLSSRRSVLVLGVNAGEEWRGLIDGECRVVFLVERVRDEKSAVCEEGQFCG